MWVVAEHHWRLVDKNHPYGRNVLEYFVYEGTIRSYTLGKYTEVCVKTKEPNGPVRLICERLECGGHVFTSAREAALYAKEKTKKYELIWRWVGKPDIPMRRTWERYLDEKEENS